MAMTVSYSVVPRKNPAKKSEPAKYYAQAQASGELDFEELCEAITSRSTCTETDVRAAISGILYEVKRALKAGRIVRLAELMKILSYQQVLTRAVAQSGAGGDSGDDPDKGSGGSGSDDDEAPDPTV